jgi:ATP-dependent helicase HepA
VTLIREPTIRPGSVLLELIYIVECSAPAALEVGRFLPPTPLRLLLDSQGRQRSAALASQLPADGSLGGECLSRNKKLARQVIETLTDKLRPLFANGMQQADQTAAPLIDDALANMQQTLGGELQRLQQLASHNPNVRQHELDELSAQREQLQHYLSNSRVRLDAVRLIVAQ